MQPHAQRRLSDGQDRRAAPTHLLFETSRRIQRSPPLDGREAAFTACPLRVPDSLIKLALHPCHQAADFLACTRPPDFVPSRRSFFGFYAPAPSSSRRDAIPG
jgi:hypothetical protein